MKKLYRLLFHHQRAVRPQDDTGESCGISTKEANASIISVGDRVRLRDGKTGRVARVWPCPKAGGMLVLVQFDAYDAAFCGKLTVAMDWELEQVDEQVGLAFQR